MGGGGGVLECIILKSIENRSLNFVYYELTICF